MSQRAYITDWKLLAFKPIKPSINHLLGTAYSDFAFYIDPEIAEEEENVRCCMFFLMGPLRWYFHTSLLRYLLSSQQAKTTATHVLLIRKASKKCYMTSDIGETLYAIIW